MPEDDGTELIKLSSHLSPNALDEVKRHNNSILTPGKATHFTIPDTISVAQRELA